MKPSPLHLRLGQLRRRLGVRTVQPGGGARTLIRTLKDKGTISIFIDQNTNEQSRDLPFLGDSAPTPITFERLVQRSNAVPLMIWNYRTPDGEYVIELAELDEADPLGSATRIAETLIRAYPSQWVWLHRRWSNRCSRARRRKQIKPGMPISAICYRRHCRLNHITKG